MPSVVLPHSYDYVINAAHPESDVLDVVEVRPLLLDNRVLSPAKRPNAKTPQNRPVGVI